METQIYIYIYIYIKIIRQKYAHGILVASLKNTKSGKVHSRL